MINFGTSAYMKVLALNPKPRDSELRKRLKGSTGGYDFHKAMRRIVANYGAGGYSIADVQAELASIKKLPERNSASQALNQVSKWLGGRKVAVHEHTEKRFVSPQELFSVKFTPDFSIEGREKRCLVHLWNTLRPGITSREALATIGLFYDDYDEFDIAILCLRTQKMFVAETGSKAKSLSALLVADIEKRILAISSGDAGGEASAAAA